MLTSCMAAKTHCCPGRLPQPLPTWQAFPLLGVGKGRARAPLGLPRLPSQSSTGSLIPFLFLLTCLVARAFPQLDRYSHPSQGLTLCWAHGPAQIGEAGFSPVEHFLHSLRSLGPQEGQQPLGSRGGALHLTDVERDQSRLPGEGGLPAELRTQPPLTQGPATSHPLRPSTCTQPCPPLPESVSTG